MLFKLWGLDEGSDWQSSIEDVHTGDLRFEANLEALRDALGFDPINYSRPLSPGGVDDDLRVATTKDVAEGYRLVAIVRLNRHKKRVILQWLGVEDLEEA